MNDDLFNTSALAKRFVRVNYDDSRSLPWIIVWGEDHILSRHRSKEAADNRANQIQVICDVFKDWTETTP